MRTHNWLVIFNLQLVFFFFFFWLCDWLHSWGLRRKFAPFFCLDWTAAVGNPVLSHVFFFFVVFLHVKACRWLVQVKAKAAVWEDWTNVHNNRTEHVLAHFEIALSAQNPTCDRYLNSRIWVIYVVPTSERVSVLILLVFAVTFRATSGLFGEV